MKHAREDYSHIQDYTGKIPKDEPVFLLRAKDKVAPYVVEAWAMMAEIAGAEDNIIDAAFEHASAMWSWQREHGSKVPDMPGNVVVDGIVVDGIVVDDDKTGADENDKSD